MEAKFIRVDGNRIRYAEEGKGPPVLLLHGLGASLEWWKLNLTSISQNHRTIAIDFLGFGFSSKPKEEFNTSLVTRFMHSLLDAFNLDKVTLVGNSFGGYIALITALCFPERVDRIVLVDSVGFGKEISLLLRVASHYPVGELALATRSRLTARLMLSRLFYDSKKLPDDLIECALRVFEQRQARKICLEVLHQGVDSKGLKEKIWRPLLEEIPHLSHQTLIIWGVDDKIVPLSQARRGLALIKNAHLVIFEKCGHLPQLEWPDKFNRSVLHFLEL